MRLDLVRPFLRESSGGGEVDEEIRRIFSRGAEGLGPQETRIWLLALDAKGYPRGDMIAALRSMSVVDAFAVEAVSHLRRRQIDELTTLMQRRSKKEQRRG